MGTSVETTSSPVHVSQVGMVLNIASTNISLSQFINSMSRTIMNELAHTVASYGCAASRTSIFQNHLHVFCNHGVARNQCWLGPHQPHSGV